jgi:integrase
MARKRFKDLDLPARMYRKNGAFWLVDSAKKWHRLAALTEKSAAMRRYEELTNPAAPLETSVAGVINKYLADHHDLAPKTRTEYERNAKYLAAAFDGINACDVLPHHIWQYLQHRKNANAAVSGNREKALLSASYSHALRHGIVNSNPCVGVGRNKERPRTRLVSDDELNRYIAWARSLKYGDLQTTSPIRKHTNTSSIFSALLISSILEIAYLTGQRRQSVLALKLSDLKEDGVEFYQGKTRVRVLVGWTPRLRAAIDYALALPRPIKAICVLSKRNGGEYTEDGIKTLTQRLMTAWVALGNERFVTQDMRAKAVTRMKDDGREVKNVTGHKTDKAIDATYDRRRIRRGNAVE